MERLYASVTTASAAGLNPEDPRATGGGSMLDGLAVRTFGKSY